MTELLIHPIPNLFRLFLILQDRAPQGCDLSGNISLEHIKELDGIHRLFSLLICSKTQSGKPTQKNTPLKMAMSAKWSHLPTKSKYLLFFVLCISSVKVICSKRQYLFKQTPFPFAKHPFCKIIATQEFRKIHGRFANTLPANKHKKINAKRFKKNI